ncbi:MAG TPA: sulfotransferase [Anaerolineales bacterium]
MSQGTAPILVTGAHRTGTTWVGRLLAADRSLAYISEPLNVLHRPGVFSAPVRFWYTYVCSDNENKYRTAFDELLAFDYHILPELAAIRSPRDLLRMGRDIAIFAGGRIGHRTPLIKDPFAVFSLRWFAERLNCRIVVTVRHPAAFASGLKRLNWSFDFEDLLNQPLLLRDHLGEYRDLMRSVPGDDVVGQAGLLWAMIYRTLHQLRQSVPDIHVVRHEDLAQQPVEGFRKLFQEVGLQYTRQVEAAIVDSSRSGNPSELSRGRTHSVKMDSRGSLGNWRRRLSEAEVDRVRKITGDVSPLYYGEESWH